MAKVVGPLFSVDASGKLANSLVFMKWRGLNTVRQYARPSNPNSQAQQRIRGNFAAAVADWADYTGFDKSAWSTRATGQPYTGFNMYIRQAVEAKEALDDFNRLTGMEISVDAGTGTADLTFTAAYESSAEVVRLQYGTAPGVYPDEQLLTLTEGENTVQLTDLLEGTEYYFRILHPEDEITVDTEPFQVTGETGDYSFVVE